MLSNLTLLVYSVFKGKIHQTLEIFVHCDVLTSTLKLLHHELKNVLYRVTSQVVPTQAEFSCNLASFIPLIPELKCYLCVDVNTTLGNNLTSPPVSE